MDPNGIDVAPIDDRNPNIARNFFNTKALREAQGIVKDLSNDRVQGSLLNCAKKLGLVKEGTMEQQKYVDINEDGDVFINDDDWDDTTRLREIVADALSNLGEGFTSGKESASDRKRNLLQLNQEQ